MVDRVAKPKYVYAAIAFASVLVLALAAVLYVTRSSTPAEEVGGGGAPAVVIDSREPAAPTTVAVAFNSEPPNAQIFIDEVDRGTTPVSVNLEVGKTYAVEILKDGFEIARQQLKVAPEPDDVTVTLEQARGVLRILSYPSDAVIFIDDEEQGATPLTLTGLETDQNYRIVAKLGAETMERSVEWGDEAQAVQDVMFEFSEGAADSALRVQVDEEKSRPKTSRKRTYKRKKKRSKPRRRARPKPEPETDDSLDVFGSASDSKPEPKSDESDDEEGFDVFGSASSDSSKDDEPAPAPKQEAKKEEEEKASEEDEGLDIWGNPKTKSAPKEEPKPKAEEKEDDGLNIW